MSSLVSIIIPTYNRASLLKRAIASVQAQTYTNWELLVIDDGSTDNTPQVVESFIKNDSRIQFFSIPHVGQPTQPRNKGLLHARGNFIAFLDSDDTWHQEKIQKQLDCFAHNKQLGVVSCCANIVKESTGKIIRQHTKLYRGNVLPQLLLNNFLLTASTIMIRREALEKVGEFDPQFKVAEDWDLCIRIAKAGYLFDYASEPLISYYIHNDNIYMGNTTFNGSAGFALLCTKHLTLLKQYQSPTLGYYYFLHNQFSKARPYLFKMINERGMGIRARVKLIACIIITFCPWLLPLAERIWRIIRRILIHNT